MCVGVCVCVWVIKIVVVCVLFDVVGVEMEYLVELEIASSASSAFVERVEFVLVAFWIVCYYV